MTFVWKRSLVSNSAQDRNGISRTIEELSVAYLFGPKKRQSKVGIGRFIDLVKPYPNAPRWAAVGCDAGDVFLISMAEESFGEIMLHTEIHKPARVWAVLGSWMNENVMRLFVATSDKEVRVHEVVVAKGSVKLSEDKGGGVVRLSDWPREIRPVIHSVESSEDAILIVCESGDVVITGEPQLSFNNSQIMRTGSAVKTAKEYWILTGSDNNKISMYRTQSTAGR